LIMTTMLSSTIVNYSHNLMLPDFFNSFDIWNLLYQNNAEAIIK
jgi:hypothetical protein